MAKVIDCFASCDDPRCDREHPPVCRYPGCKHGVTMRYPGNDPENGPARRYCPDGHSTCYSCGRPFQAITHYPESTVRYEDDDADIVVPAFFSESDCCLECEELQVEGHDEGV